jgi:hypothetical protein
MVRRDEDGREAAQAAERPASCCASPTGESPAPVGAGTPGSRSQASGESPTSRAGRRKPPRGEQARGPQHQVKPAASSDLQRGRRAAHVTAKATSRVSASRDVRARGSSGVLGAARVQGETRNTRGPSALPSSRQGGSYKPKAKSSAAQRESEGVVVPVSAGQPARTNVVQNNAAGGKGPCFGPVRGVGTCEGMAGKTGPNNPRCTCIRTKHNNHNANYESEPSRRVPAASCVESRVRGDARTWTQGVVATGRTHAPARRPSVSRVREIRTHGLKGGSALSPKTHVIE